MSSIPAITAIIIVLAILVCYAFISQTIQHKREQKARLLSALTSRSRNFKFMLNGFPEGFLSKELTLLVQKSLVEVCEQLSKAEPSNPAHLQDLQIISAKMNETHRQARPSQPSALASQQQIKEVKMCLEELHKFIYQLEAKNTISANQADSYRTQVTLLVVQITVDGYALQAQSALQHGKLKLALHNYESAVNLMVREGKPGQFDGRLQKTKAIIAEINQQLAEESGSAPNTAVSSAMSDETSKEWDDFGESTSEDVWKKKSIYD